MNADNYDYINGVIEFEIIEYEVELVKIFKNRRRRVNF